MNFKKVNNETKMKFDSDNQINWLKDLKLFFLV